MEQNEVKYYIGRTSAYYEGDDDGVFTPDYWTWENNPNLLAGEIHELNEDGVNLMIEWGDDYSAGYDLCSGRAKGLAARYSKEEIFQKLCSPEYSTEL